MVVVVWVLVLCAALLLTHQAGAMTIDVNPGTVGTTGTLINMPFADLNGTSLAGQTLDLDFVFADARDVEVSQPAGFYAVDLILTFPSCPIGTNCTGTPIVGGVLSDEDGLSVASPFASGTVVTATQLTYTLFFSGIDGLIHHDVHFEATLLASAPTVEVGSGTLNLRGSGGTTMTVVSAPVPEPASFGLGLLASGFVALAGLARKGDRHR